MSVAVVTGATGFIGGHLTERLVRDGWTVHALKRTTSSLAALAEILDAVQFHNVDVTPLESVWDSIGAADVVFHLATAYGREDQSSSSVVETNVLFPLQLLEQAPHLGVKLFVSTDTCFTPDYPYLQPYTVSKKQFAEWGRLKATQPNFKFVNLELQHPYGPGDRDGKFVPWVMKQCVDNVPSIDLTSGEQQKDFIYVADVVDAYLKLYQAADLLPEGFADVPCGSGISTTVREFVTKVHAAAQSTSELRFGALPYRSGEVMRSCADPHILKDLGWSASVTIEEGIRRTLASFRPMSLMS